MAESLFHANKRDALFSFHASLPLEERGIVTTELRSAYDMSVEQVLLREHLFI